MANTWYTRSAVEARKARKKMGSNFLPEFWMKDGESAKVIYLDKDPVYLYQHQFNVRGKVKTYTCIGKGCPLCMIKDPRYVAVYRIIDTRKYKDKQGKVISNKERYHVVGSRLQPTLERIEKNHQLFRRVVELTRTGASTDTTYTAIPIGKPKIEIASPKLDTLKDYAPKSRDELEMIAETLGLEVEREKNIHSHDDDDEDEKPEKKTRSYLEDEDEDEDNEDSDDTDEESEDEDEDDDTEDESDDEDEEPEDEDDDDAEEDDESDEDDEEPPPVVKKKKKTTVVAKPKRKVRR